ncbi:Hypothetical protein ORPV_968 [Orpheovirus IHUMI-LCC2]|uniref:MORN-repeat protein n=1 Tax=Orpheovirus IHUMI-LCC2 TaxID=2023057 RepID=A0A2I2L5P7_9VIRU|nr:Hypothetical protein ORPV_968 [Orpheovirus IHUMI-LCC2]SNW62872.1 Hypothetical protein ORPV_968 [Orpheovirus IHUMI-LCC2]
MNIYDIPDEILHHYICFHDLQVYIPFSILGKRFNNISKYNGKQEIHAFSYFLEYIENENGSTIEKYYINRKTGKKYGKYISLFGNINNRKKIECWYREDVLYGTFTRYDGNKKKIECTYVNDKLQGKHIEYDIMDNKIESYYVDGNLEGPYIITRKDGKLLQEKHYIYNGEKSVLNGLCIQISYHTRGKTEKRTIYSNGRLVYNI